MKQKRHVSCFFSKNRSHERGGATLGNKKTKQVMITGRMAGRDTRTRQMRGERIHEQTTGHAAHKHR